MTTMKRRRRGTFRPRSPLRRRRDFFSFDENKPPDTTSGRVDGELEAEDRLSDI